MSLVSALKGVGPSGFGYGSTAEEVTEGVDLSEKNFLLTGCNSGLGMETLRVLSLRGGHIIAAARTEEKALGAISEVSANATPVSCDLSEPESVFNCVKEIKQRGFSLDGIICNAGIMALPTHQQKHGCELQFLTNHIGHFILVTELLGSLSETGRIVIVSSSAHKSAPSEGIMLDNLNGEKWYSPWKAYGHSKLANVIFAKHLSVRLANTRQTANSLHPGVIQTNLGRHMNPIIRVGLTIAKPLFLKNVEQGASTQCYLAANPKAAEISGEYFSDCNLAKTSKQGQDGELAQKLWEASEKIVAGLK